VKGKVDMKVVAHFMPLGICIIKRDLLIGEIFSGKLTTAGL
jgi:hypothetical protein